MVVDQNSLQINTIVSAESKTTEYSFLWQNFSIIQGNQIIVGDVFKVHNFFSQLYGDAEVQISYPQNFNVNSVIPTPYQQDNSAKTLEWARTQDLVASETRIILANNPINSNDNQNNLQQYAIVGSIILVVIIGLFGGFFEFKRRKRNGETATLTEIAIETEEDRILKIIKTAGGNLRQSDIVEQCRFSKAKTSQLLTILEQKGKITRLKRGRDKIVSLKETAKR